MMIVLSGASSVGKSTLAGDWCRKHTEYHRLREVARDIMKDRSITRDDLWDFLASQGKQKFFQFQDQIFQEQNTRETLFVQNDLPFIADRGPDPLVFVEQNMNFDSALKLAETQAAKMCLQRYRSKNCVVIVVCPLKDIEDDSVRMVPTNEEQIRYTESLKQLLQRFDVPYKYCDQTDRHERLKWLEKAVFTSTVNV